MNAEQLLTWDPDWIIAMPGKGGTDLASSDAFKPLRAVSQGNVLISPQAPLGLDGRPALGEPGDRRCLGGGDHLPGRLQLRPPEKEVREFYSLFYHHELTDSELNEILAGAGRRN